MEWGQRPGGAACIPSGSHARGEAFRLRAECRISVGACVDWVECGSCKAVAWADTSLVGVRPVCPGACSSVAFENSL